MEGRAGVGFVGLDVVVAEDAFISSQLFVGEGVVDEVAVFVLGVIALELGEDGAEGGGQVGEGFVLLRGKVVLALFSALDLADDHIRAVGVTDEIGGQDAAVAEAESGRTIVITRHNEPVAQLGPARTEHAHRGARVGEGRVQPALKRGTKGRYLAVLLEDRSSR